MTIRVLLIEDDQGDAEVAARHLADWSQISRTQIEVVRATDMDCAITKIAERPFDHIFTDLSVPSYTGVEMIEILTKICNGTPIIAYSGYLDTERITDALDAGAVHFVSKEAGRDTFGAAMATAGRHMEFDAAITRLANQFTEVQSAIDKMKREPASKAEMVDVAKAAAKEAVTQTFCALGIDPNDAKEMRATHNDLAWLRDFRKSIAQTKTRAWLTIVSLKFVSAIGALWLGFKGNITGK